MSCQTSKVLGYIKDMFRTHLSDYEKSHGQHINKISVMKHYFAKYNSVRMQSGFCIVMRELLALVVQFYLWT